MKAYHEEEETLLDKNIEGSASGYIIVCISFLRDIISRYKSEHVTMNISSDYNVPVVFSDESSGFEYLLSTVPPLEDSEGEEDDEVLQIDAEFEKELV